MVDELARGAEASSVPFERNNVISHSPIASATARVIRRALPLNMQTSKDMTKFLVFEGGGMPFPSNTGDFGRSNRTAAERGKTESPGGQHRVAIGLQNCNTLAVPRNWCAKYSTSRRASQVQCSLRLASHFARRFSKAHARLADSAARYSSRLCEEI
jgi:hypothetical protein